MDRCNSLPGLSAGTAGGRRTILNPMRKFLIVTADDFGLHESVNEGRGTRQPRRGADGGQSDGGRTGRGRCDSPRAQAAGIAGWPASRACGRVGNTEPRSHPGSRRRSRAHEQRMFANGVRFFLSSRVRRQLEAEIRAQFRRSRAPASRSTTSMYTSISTCIRHS